MITKYLSLYRELKTEVKAALWYTVCNVLQKGISFIVVPIYVRLLTTEEYGRYNLFLSWKEILIIFATLNLFYGVYTKSIVEYSDDRDRYTSSIQGLCTTITVIFTIAYIVISIIAGELLIFSIPVFALLVLYFLFVPSYMFWTARQRVEYKYVSMVIVTLIVSILIPIVGIILLYNTDLREDAIICGYLGVQAIIGLFFYVKILRKGRVFFNHRYWVKGLKFNIPLIPYYLSVMVLNQSDRIMIEKFDGADKTGIYSLAYQISFMVNVICDAINGSLTPWVYKNLKEMKYKIIKPVSTAITFFVMAIIVLVIFVAPDVVRILGTSEYYDAIWIIPSVCTSVYFIFCYNLICNTEFYYDMPYFITITTLTGAVINVLLNWILIPIYGYVVAGQTTAISFFVAFLVHCFVYLFIRKRKMNGCDALNIRLLLLSCIGMLALSYIALYVYTIGIVCRYVIVIVILVLGIVKRRSIMTYFAFLRKKE